MLITDTGYGCPALIRSRLRDVGRNLPGFSIPQRGTNAIERRTLLGSRTTSGPRSSPPEVNNPVPMLCGNQPTADGKMVAACHAVGSDHALETAPIGRCRRIQRRRSSETYATTDERPAVGVCGRLHPARARRGRRLAAYDGEMVARSLVLGSGSGCRYIQQEAYSGTAPD